RAQALEHAHDRVDVGPRTRRAAAPAVHDEPGRVLGDVWVEHVQQTTEHTLLLPAAAAERRAARRAAPDPLLDLRLHGSTIFAAMAELPQRACVVGGGTMGAGIATVFALAGIPTTV